MTDKVHPSFNREAARSRETSVAIAYGGGAGDGWVWPSSSRLVADSEGDLASGALNAFGESHSASSLDVTIDTGEAARRGAYLARDTTTTVTLPANSTTTIELGWKDGAADTVLIGDTAGNAGDTITADDPSAAIWTFTTDGSGVTGVTDERRMADDFRIPADAVESTGVDVQDDGSSVVDPATILDFGGGYFDVTNPTADEAQVAIASTAIDTAELVDAAVTTAKIAGDAVTASEILDGAVGSAEIATDAVDTDEIATDAVTAAEILADAVGTSEIDLSIAPTWTGAHTYNESVGLRGSDQDALDGTIGSSNGELARGATSDTDVILGGDAGSNTRGWFGYNVEWSDADDDWVCINANFPSFVLWHVIGQGGPGVELGVSPASQQANDGDVISFTGSLVVKDNGDWVDTEAAGGPVIWDRSEGHVPADQQEGGESVATTGTATLSSGSAVISTGVTTTGTHVDVRLDPSGGGNNTSDVKVSARAFWDNSAGEYKVEILEDGTTVGNPDIGYKVVTS